LSAHINQDALGNNGVRAAASVNLSKLNQPQDFNSRLVRAELKHCLLEMEKRGREGLQLSLSFNENAHNSNVTCELERKAILQKIHYLIFKRHIHYLQVFNGLREFARQQKCMQEFMPWITDPESMLCHCISESEENESFQQNLLEFIALITKPNLI